VRLFTSAAGPDSVTRLVLLVMASKMNQDGTRCTVGSRKLADLTALNKDTVTRRRATAIELGWLWPPTRAKGARLVEWLPSVPAAVVALIDEAPAVSDGAGHSEGNSVSDGTGASVRPQRLECPTGSDIPASTSLYQPAAGAQPLEQRRLRLLSIVQDLRSTGSCRTPDDAERMFPIEHRYPGYGDDIRRTWKRPA